MKCEYAAFWEAPMHFFAVIHYHPEVYYLEEQMYTRNKT